MNDKERDIRLKLKSDFIHYASKCLQIRSKATNKNTHSTIIPFTLNTAQAYVHKQLEMQKGQTGKVRALICKGRQMGMSTYIGARFFHIVTHHFGYQAFIMTHSMMATENLFRMADRFYEHVPPFVRPSIEKSNAKELHFGSLDSGYKLGTAENKNVGRSSTIQLLHGCLSGDSLIVLADGTTIPMLYINIGDMVLTSSGDIAPVKNKIYTGQKQTLELKCWNASEPIYLTSEHKVLTKDGYKEAASLTTSDFIAMPKIKNENINYYDFNLKNIDRPQGGGSKHIESHRFILDFNFGYFIGYYLAEGHIKDTRNYITFTYHEDEKFIEQALKGIAGLPTSINHVHQYQHHRKRTYVYGKFLSSAVYELCGRVKDKHIPLWFMHANDDFLKGLIAGYLDGDGCKGRGDSITAPSIHEKISRQLQRLIWRIYGACSVKKFPRHRYNRKTKDVYLLRICGNTLKKYKNITVNDKRHKSIVIEGIVYCRVKSISPRRIEDVWDIEIDHPDHNYQTTCGIVSNSEVAFWKNTADHTKGILQAVPNATGTEIILESTANGTGNYFHQQWQLAENGMTDYIPIFVPWFWQDEYREEVPPDFQLNFEEKDLKEFYGLDDEQLCWRRNKIIQFSDDANGGGERWFKQEYPCTASEAFQTSGDTSYITSDMVMLARKCEEPERFGPKLLGVDVARYGDDLTCLIRRQGRVAYGLETYAKKSTMEIAAIVLQAHTLENFDRIYVDVVGVGAGVVDRLKELIDGDVVVPVNSGTTPYTPQRYRNKRAEMWGLCKAWMLDEPCKIPDDDALTADLTGTLYSYNSNSQLIMEKKEDSKKRGIRSPDRADSLCLTFAEPNLASVKKSATAANKLMNKLALDLQSKNRARNRYVY